MWETITNGRYSIFINKQLELKISVSDDINANRVYVNYKGYNIAFAMEMWGFGAECLSWDIKEQIIGSVPDSASTVYFLIQSADTRAFLDLVYFFLKENNADGMIREEYKISFPNEVFGNT